MEKFAIKIWGSDSHSPYSFEGTLDEVARRISSFGFTEAVAREYAEFLCAEDLGLPLKRLVQARTTVNAPRGSEFVYYQFERTPLRALDPVFEARVQASRTRHAERSAAHWAKYAQTERGRP